MGRETSSPNRVFPTLSVANGTRSGYHAATIQVVPSSAASGGVIVADALKKILIADDNALSLTSLALLLKRMGFESVTARDGAEAGRSRCPWQ